MRAWAAVHALADFFSKTKDPTWQRAPHAPPALPPQVAERAAGEGGDPPTLDPVADLKLNSLGEGKRNSALLNKQHEMHALACCACVPAWEAWACLARPAPGSVGRRTSRPPRSVPNLLHFQPNPLICLPPLPLQADLVGDLRLRAALATERAALPCHRDPLLPEMFAIVHRCAGMRPLRWGALECQHTTTLYPHPHALATHPPHHSPPHNHARPQRKGAGGAPGGGGAPHEQRGAAAAP